MTPNNWDTSSDPEITESIVRRCYNLEPSLAPSVDAEDPATTIPILKVNVGLRPARTGEARVEREEFTLPLPARHFVPTSTASSQTQRKANVVHAYGFGPAGFQASWGVAEDVLTLVGECFAG